MTDAPAVDLRLVPSAVGAWAATVVAVGAGWRPAAALAAVCVLVAVVGWWCRRRHGWGSVVMLVVVAACCVTAAFAAMSSLRMHEVTTGPVREGALGGAYATVEGVVTDDPRPITGSFADQVLVPIRASRVTLRGTVVDGSARITVFAPPDPWRALEPGVSVTFRARLAAPDRVGAVDAVARATGPPEVGSAPALLRWSGVVRRALAEAAAIALPREEEGLLPGMVVGDRSGLDVSVQDSFTAAGMSHLTAVSGANFSFVIGCVVLGSRLLSAGPRTTAALAGIVLVAFVVVARPSPSVLRAAVMGVLGLLAVMTGRRRHVMPALCTAVLVLLAVDPGLAVSWGFALSVTATVALVLLAPVLTAMVSPADAPPGRRRPVLDAVAVALAAHLVTAPLVAAMAGTFSVYSVAANVLAAPVVGPVTVIGALAAVVAVVSVEAGAVVAGVAWVPLRWLLAVAAYTADAPGATVLTPTGPRGAAVVGGCVLVAAGAAVLVRRRWLSAHRGTIDR
ncbi:ComEC/Rec2 family competence protein [Rhodococcus sp. BP-149]|uniref:ComEC/Rec2 family competence protein n=1 Tax=unclassified Rhodococcus (in: high G+C Gram-positive bacteria) TaxID=192944 RepID=UPI001C9A4D6D|nr:MULTISPECIES: ComEC/Rec2 family competence protein [unclassified Rhodococcus (in: high G+C Gram-positive bacteria)]MBY6686370.1 ComEC/Rec2 family competence protein [Rhodococcus sp. BP-288]MBY6693541.1 ComEC/Rec2 family competence protein [Rhodococcus sp. BP-188]MBY6699862.1 ComEC/Rec2 family competence protein [Rhodococcus sp. BP-285]MBY6703793.1 ComEC/Rec2 family competence protein [Rhodococcus sp. BP-283]MBY6711059.1 ComEC/Rec2 family competence protein [Rhodococcus sp. BP-160]